MKQIVQSYRSGELRLWDVPAPATGPVEIAVEVSRSAISPGTEKLMTDLARSSLLGKAISRPDLVRQVLNKAKHEGVLPTLEKVLAKLDDAVPLGYSVSGRVVSVGAQVTWLRAGDRVACAGAGFASHAQFVSVPRNLVVRVPDGVDDDAACLVAPGAIAMQGIRQAGASVGEVVTVIGLGLIGQLTAQMLVASGCRVVASDPDPAKRELAARLGVSCYAPDDLPQAVQSLTGGRGTDAVLVCASTKSSEPVNTAAALARLKGRIVVIGMVGLDLVRDLLYKKELELKFSMSYGPGRYDPGYEEHGQDYPFAYVRWTEQRNMAAFLDLAADKRIDPAALITHRFALEQAHDAYALFDGTEPYLGIVLTYPTGANPQRTVAIPRTDSAPATVSLGLLGAGNFARTVLLPALRAMPEVSFATVVTKKGVTARQAAERFGFRTASTDPSSVLDDAGLNTVVIATRHDSHSAYVAKALAAHKNVFCEKPLAIEREGLAAVVDAYQRSRGLLCVGFNRRFAPFIIAARDALEGAGPRVMAYRVNAGSVPSEHWTRGTEGGGRILGEVCHFVDTLLFLCGSHPVRVQASAVRGHDDALSVQIAFADGSIGTIVYSSLGDPAVAKERLEIFASGRVVIIDDFRRLSVVCGGRTRKKASMRQDKGHAALIGRFIAAVTEGAAAPIPFEDIVAVTETTLQIAEALGA